VADDIVTRLRIIHCAADDLTPCGTCLICEAAAEIQWLRAAGDLLAAALRVETVNGQMAVCDGTNEAFQTWQEVRRG
jgi:uncharacterized membrane protein YcgQ (UPF0703/DUF1980 family)